MGIFLFDVQSYLCLGLISMDKSVCRILTKSQVVSGGYDRSIGVPLYNDKIGSIMISVSIDNTDQ